MPYEQRVGIPRCLVDDKGLFQRSKKIKVVTDDNDAAAAAIAAFNTLLAQHLRDGDEISGETLDPANGAGSTPEYFVAFYANGYTHSCSDGYTIRGRYYLIPAKHQAQAWAVMCQEHGKPYWLKPVTIGKRPRAIQAQAQPV